MKFSGMKRTASLLMVLSLSMSALMFTSCSGTKDEENKSSGELASVEWFDSREVTLLDMSDCNGYGTNGGTTDGLIYTDGDVFLVDEMIYYGNDETRKLEEFDRDGNVLISVDINSDIIPPSGNNDYINPRFFVVDDTVNCLLMDRDNKFYLAPYDSDAETFVEWEELTDLNLYLTMSDTIPYVGVTDDQTVKIYVLSWLDATSSSVSVITMDEDHKCTQTDLTPALTQAGMTGAHSVYGVSDNECILFGYDQLGNDKAIYVNEETMESNPLDDTSFLWNACQCGGSILLSDGFTISEYDAATGTVEELMNLDKCNVNRYDAMSMKPVFVDGERIVLFGIVCIDNNNMAMKTMELTASDTNPYEGKTMLRVVELDQAFDYGIAEAIRQFNETDPNAYLVMDRRYEVDPIETDGGIEYFFSDEGKLDRLTSDSGLSNQLMFDLLAGDGPDIILNGHSFSLLNSDNCLVDLTSYIDGPDGIDRSLYFNNVFEGNPYQIALAAQPYGVLYYADATGYSITEPTYDEYRQFVSEGCNGTDAIGMENGRLSYFLTLFENLYPQLSDDAGRPQLDNDEFRALAEYCLTLPENAGYLGDTYCENAYFSVYSLNWGEFTHSGDTLMGLPSQNGMAHRMRTVYSAAISEACADRDAAWRFVKLLLSEDIQSQINSGWPSVMREVSRNAIAESIARNNEEAENYEPIADWDEGPDVLDTRATDWYCDAMDSALPSVYCDPDILKVMFEEIQPYFAGQKTLDEVIPIIEDRCSTIINERG